MPPIVGGIVAGVIVWSMQRRKPITPKPSVMDALLPKFVGRWVFIEPIWGGQALVGMLKKVCDDHLVFDTSHAMEFVVVMRPSDARSVGELLHSELLDKHWLAHRETGQCESGETAHEEKLS